MFLVYSVLFSLMFVKFTSTTTNVSAVTEIITTAHDDSSQEQRDIISLLFTFANPSKEIKASNEQQRVKRSSKFRTAADMGQTKVLRLIMACFSNPFKKEYLGGAHPMHKDVPKAVSYWFRDKIFGYLFPPIGAPEDKNAE